MTDVEGADQRSPALHTHVECMKSVKALLVSPSRRVPKPLLRRESAVWNCVARMRRMRRWLPGVTWSSTSTCPGATPKRNAGPFPERGRSPSGGKGPALRFSRPPTPLIPHGNGPVPSNRSVAPSARRRKACRQVRRDGPRRVGDDPAGRGVPQGGRARRNASAGVRQARTLRGRAFRRSWTALTSASVTFRKSVPLGRYPRTRPLVCSFRPRSQEW